MTPTSKLYVIVRNTLSPIMQGIQAAHAARAFQSFYPDLELSWFQISNNLVFLEHEDIDDLANRLERHGLRLSRFHEEDRGGEMTAFCVEPEAKRHVAHLSLAGATA